MQDLKKISSVFANIIHILKYEKKIRLSKYIWFTIIIKCNLRYHFEWDIINFQSDPSEKIELKYVGVCKALNYNIIADLVKKVSNPEIGLFIAGYLGNESIKDFLITKKVSRKSLLYEYGTACKNGLDWYGITNGFFTSIFPFIIRGLSYHSDFENFPYDFRKFFYCNECGFYKCNRCRNLINDGFYGACEGGRLGNVKFFYNEATNFEFFININRGLYLATKHRHFRVAEFLINKGAVYPKYVFEDFYNNLLNYI